MYREAATVTAASRMENGHQGPIGPYVAQNFFQCALLGFFPSFMRWPPFPCSEIPRSPDRPGRTEQLLVGAHAHSLPRRPAPRSRRRGAGTRPAGHDEHRGAARHLLQSCPEPGVGGEVQSAALSSRIKILGCRTRARAMVSRCRWPPEKFRPPCSTGESSPLGFSRTKSAAWAVSRACHNSLSLAPGLPHCRFSRMVPWNRAARWGTTPTASRSWSKGQSFTFTPPISTAPWVAS